MFKHWQDAINLLSGAKMRRSHRLGERLDKSPPPRRTSETQEMLMFRQESGDPGDNHAAPTSAP